MTVQVPLREENVAVMRPQYRHISPTTVIIAFTLLVFCTVSVVSRLPNVNPKNEWDILIFTQNWPKTVCLTWEDKDAKHKCDLPSDNDKWTIHGLWPTKIGTKGPWFCNTSYPWNTEEIYGLLPRLEVEWTPVEVHKKKTDFWRHEWEKHGTCSAVLPPLSTELKYFATALSLGERFNMGGILKAAGIFPRDEGYDPVAIWSAVYSHLGKKPFIMCYTEPKTKLSFLQEIRICFDKKLQLVNCDGIKSSGAGEANSSLIECSTKKPTHYLSQVPAEAQVIIRPDHPLVTTLKTIKLLQWMTL